MTARSSTLGSGMAIAVISSAAFALSGPLAKSLMDAGWSPGAAVFARVAGAALVLLVPVIVLSWPSRGRVLTRHATHLGAYGLFAIAGAMVGFFSAVQTLPVGVALLIEYTSPVLVVAWLWVTKGQRPGRLSALGGVISMIGLVFVLNLSSGGGLDPAGVAWAVWAACCLTGYFLLSARTHDGLSPVIVVGAGMVVGSVVLAFTGIIGLVPMVFTTAQTTLAGQTLPWWALAAGLVLITSVFSYLTGIMAVRRLGARLASFVALVEVLFAVLAAWLLLSELPTGQQLVGGALIIAGVVCVRLGEPELEPEDHAQIEGAEPIPA